MPADALPTVDLEAAERLARDVKHAQINRRAFGLRESSARIVNAEADRLADAVLGLVARVRQAERVAPADGANPEMPVYCCIDASRYVYLVRFGDDDRARWWLGDPGGDDGAFTISFCPFCGARLPDAALLALRSASG